MTKDNEEPSAASAGYEFAAEGGGMTKRPLRYFITLPCYAVMAALIATEPAWKIAAIAVTLAVTDFLSFYGALKYKD